MLFAGLFHIYRYAMSEAKKPPPPPPAPEQPAISHVKVPEITKETPKELPKELPKEAPKAETS
jgi:ubiquinol-cytochrome c reductase cytochrome b subunit